MVYISSSSFYFNLRANLVRELLLILNWIAGTIVPKLVCHRYFLCAFYALLFRWTVVHLIFSSYLWKPVLLVLFLLKIGTLLQVSATKRPLTMIFIFMNFVICCMDLFLFYSIPTNGHIWCWFNFFVWTKQVIWIQLKQTIKLIISYCARSKSIWKEAVRRFKQVQCMYFQLRFDAIYMINKSKRKKNAQ